MQDSADDALTLRDDAGNFISQRRLTKMQAIRRRRQGVSTQDGLDLGSKIEAPITSSVTHGQRRASFVSILATRNDTKEKP
jgi:hypothetical protein